MVISGHQWQSAATCSFSSSNQWSSVAISGHLLILLQQSVVISGNQRPPAHSPPAISGHQWQSAATCSFSSSSTAAPKSISLTGESASLDMSTMFSGLISRCTMPHECRW